MKLYKVRGTKYQVEIRGTCLPQAGEIRIEN